MEFSLAVASVTCKYCRTSIRSLWLLLEQVLSPLACIGDPTSIKIASSCHIKLFLYIA